MNYFEVVQGNTTLEMSKLISDIKDCFEKSRGPLRVYERRQGVKFPIVVRDHKNRCTYPEPQRFNGDWNRLQRGILHPQKEKHHE